MYKTILLFLIVLSFESLHAQTLKKQIIKKVFDKIYCIEEYDFKGNLLFSKKFNELDILNKDLGNEIEIRANILNTNEQIVYKIQANNRAGYQIDKLVYLKDGNEVNTYATNATEDNDGKIIGSLAFFNDLSGFTEFINHPYTKEILQKKSQLYNRKDFKNGKLVRQVYLNSYGDSTQFVYYNYGHDFEKRWYTINNRSDVLINKFDSVGRISSVIQILDRDTLYVITHKYSKNNQLVESIHNINPLGYGDRSYKELYFYNTEGLLVKKLQADMKDQPQYINEYRYNKDLITEEAITVYKPFGTDILKESYTIAYYYKFY